MEKETRGNKTCKVVWRVLQTSRRSRWWPRTGVTVRSERKTPAKEEFGRRTSQFADSPGEGGVSQECRQEWSARVWSPEGDGQGSRQWAHLKGGRGTGEKMDWPREHAG